MTDTEWVEDESQGYDPHAVVNVHVKGADVPLVSRTERHAPDFASTMNWTVTQQGQGRPTQILTRRLRRYKAKIVIMSAGGATAVLMNAKEDALTGAGQGLSWSVAALPYQIPDWESQQPLYAFGVGGQPTINVIDETYAE
jgi:hypothetical protein